MSKLKLFICFCSRLLLTCGSCFLFLQDNIVLIGHSAGGHLCALTTLFLVDEKEELFIEASKQRNITKAIRGVIGKEHRVV